MPWQAYRHREPLNPRVQTGRLSRYVGLVDVKQSIDLSKFFIYELAGKTAERVRFLSSFDDSVSISRRGQCI